jgi:hypothetical protein
MYVFKKVKSNQQQELIPLIERAEWKQQEKKLYFGIER